MNESEGDDGNVEWRLEARVFSFMSTVTTVVATEWTTLIKIV